VSRVQQSPTLGGKTHPCSSRERSECARPLEKAAMIANHASTRTTQLYDRRNDEVSLDEVERILI